VANFIQLKKRKKNKEYKKKEVKESIRLSTEPLDIVLMKFELTPTPRSGSHFVFASTF